MLDCSYVSVEKFTFGLNLTHATKMGSVDTGPMSVKNPSFIQAIESYYLQSGSDLYRQSVIDIMLTIYASNPSNYNTLRPYRILPQFIDRFPEYCDELKVRFPFFCTEKLS